MHNFIAKNIAKYGEDEITIATLHRHWFNVLSSFSAVFAMIFFIFISHYFLPFFFPALSDTEGRTIFLFLETSFSMLVLILFFLIWIDYYFDVWIITNKRIINIEQHSLFSREISELELDKIQDVSTSIQGVIPTFLNYGNVFVQTAGEVERFKFKKIPDPCGIKDLIMSLEKTNERRLEKERSIIEARELKTVLQDAKIS